jgi:hypothetical protein
MNNLKLNSKERFKIETCPCGKSNKDGKFVPFEGHTKFGFCHSCSETILPNDLSTFAYLSALTIYNLNLFLNSLSFLVDE